MVASSRIKLRSLDANGRHDQLAETTGLDQNALQALRPEHGPTVEQADHMIENAVGTIGIPVGIACNFVINGREVLVPMATEEPDGRGTCRRRDQGPPDGAGAVKLLEVSTAQELARSLSRWDWRRTSLPCRALAAEGIQRGHMSLHASNIAIAAGATRAELPDLTWLTSGRSGVEVVLG